MEQPLIVNVSLTSTLPVFPENELLPESPHLFESLPTILKLSDCLPSIHHERLPLVCVMAKHPHTRCRTRGIEPPADSWLMPHASCRCALRCP